MMAKDGDVGMNGSLSSKKLCFLSKFAQSFVSVQNVSMCTPLLSVAIYSALYCVPTN